MLTGILLVLLGGTMWSILGMISTLGKNRNIPVAQIQPFAGILTLLVTGWTAFIGTPFVFNKAGIVLVVLVLLVGVSNYFMLVFIEKAVRASEAKGGVIWAFTQSATVCPFAMGILFFGEIPAPVRLGGMILIILALILFSLEKNSGNARNRAWILPVLFAFMLAGSAQCLASLPAYFQLSGLTPVRRMLLMNTGILIPFVICHSIRLKMPDFRNVRLWRYAALYAFSNIIALILFYNGQNILANLKCAGISYPAGQGMSIALVFLIRAFQSNPGKLSWGAFFCLLAGIFLLAF